MSDTDTSFYYVLADYQQFGDWEVSRWATAIFDDAQEKGKIESYQILATSVGPYGLEFISFIVKIALTEGTKPVLEDRATDYLCGIVNDGDVSVRWVSTVEPKLFVSLV